VENEISLRTQNWGLPAVTSRDMRKHTLHVNSCNCFRNTWALACFLFDQCNAQQHWTEYKIT